MDAISLALSLAVAALILAPMVYGTYRVLARDDGRLRLFEVLRGQGLALPEAASEASVLAGAQAVRRCVHCPSQAACDPLLARGDWQALRALCPNQEYIDRQRQGAALS